MNPPEPPPGLESVSTRPPRRAGRVIAYAVLTAAGSLGATIVYHALLWPGFDKTGQSPSFAQQVWLGAQGGIVSGALIGAAQWIVIRRWIRDLVAGAGDRFPERGRRVIRESAWWIVATTGGSLIGGTLNVLVELPLKTNMGFSLIGSLFFATLSGATLGAALGTTQWFYIRGQVCQAGRWIRITVIGCLVANLLISAIFLLVIVVLNSIMVNHKLIRVLFSCLLMCVHGLLCGAVQGWYLVRFKPGSRYDGIRGPA